MVWTIIRLPPIKVVDAVEASLAVVTAPSTILAVVTELSARKETQAEPFQNSGCPVVTFSPATPATGLAGRVAFVQRPNWVPMNVRTSDTLPAAIVVALAGIIDVAQELSRSFLADGKLDPDEINRAFGKIANAPIEKKKEGN